MDSFIPFPWFWLWTSAKDHREERMRRGWWIKKRTEGWLGLAAKLACDWELEEWGVLHAKLSFRSPVSLGTIDHLHVTPVGTSERHCWKDGLSSTERYQCQETGCGQHILMEEKISHEPVTQGIYVRLKERTQGTFLGPSRVYPQPFSEQKLEKPYHGL